MSRKKSGRLTPKQLQFCKAYIENGKNCYRASIACGDSEDHAKRNSYLYLKDLLIQQYLEQYMKSIEQQMQDDYHWKLNKLKKFVILAIPDEAEYFSETHSSGVAAIAEMNKMQGHYAAEKHAIAVKEDKDLEIGNALTREMIKNHERDY